MPATALEKPHTFFKHYGAPMSNCWSYDLLFGNLNPITDKMVAETIEVVNESGYFFSTPINGMSVNGENSLEFCDAAVAGATMCKDGGLLTLWKDCEKDHLSDICVTFHPESREISVGLSCSLQEERPGDAQIAADLHNIFVTLCRRLDPLYGYSTDEWGLEMCFSGKDGIQKMNAFKAAVQQMEPPPVLFWVNYFNSRYLSRIDGRALSSMRHRRQHLEHGDIVYLAENIWNVAFGFLGPDGLYRY